MAKATKPGKKWADLSPAYRARLEAAYKAGKFGQGYSSPGRAYAAGAPRQAARGQATTSEAARSKARREISKARAWSKKHSRDKLTAFEIPAGMDTVTAGELAAKYNTAMAELEKGWKSGPASRRKQVDWAAVANYWAAVELAADDWETYLGIST